MKMPTYQRQTKMPTTTGGAMLSVQASPGVMGLPGAAMGQFGQTVETEGLRWLKTEIEKERSAELTANGNTYNTLVTQAVEAANQLTHKDWSNQKDQYGRQNIYTTPLKRWALIKDRLTNAAQTQSNSISSSAVRRDFMTAAHKQIAGIRPGVMSLLRGKHSDFYKEELARKALADTKRLALAGAGTTLRNSQEIDIAQDYRKLGRLGNLKESFVEDQIRKIFSDADELEIDRRFGAENVTPEDLAELHNDIFEGKKYKWLSSSAQGRLATRADKRHDSVTRAAINAELKNERDEAKKAKRDQDAYFQLKVSNINKLRAQENKGEDPTEEMPTVDDVNVWHAERKIRDDQRNKLVENIKGLDTVYNTEFVNFLRKDIRDAVTESDLELLEGQVREAHINRLIGGKASGELMAFIDAARNKTPQFEEKVRYEKLLAVALSKKESAFAAGLFGKKSDLAMAEAQMIAHYNDQVAGGMRPQAAFLQALERGGNVQKESIRLEIQMMDPLLMEAFGAKTMSDVTTDLVGDLTLDQVDDAYQTWRDIATGKRLPGFDAEAHITPRTTKDMQARQFVGERDERITRAERMTTRRLYAMERQINFVRAWVLSEAKKNKVLGNGNDSSANETSGASTNDEQTRAQRAKNLKKRGR